MDKRIVIPGAALASAAALLGAACGGADERSSAASNPPSPTCPAAWRSGWQRLADRVRFRVYCPGWIPSPLNARIDGRFSSGVSVGKDRSYLAGFIWFERGSGEVHVNFRGYPNRRSIPTCVGGEQVPRKIPCFTDRRGTKRIGAARVTLYTVNRDADQWHLLYLWRRAGSLYTLSEHVAPPYSYKRVLKNLDRMMRNLVLIEPSR